MQGPAAWLLAFAICAGCSGGSQRDTTAPPETNTPAEALSADLQGLDLPEFYAESFAALLARTPEAALEDSAQSVAPPGGPLLNDLSDEYIGETYDMYRAVLGALEEYDRDALDEQERIDYDVYHRFLEDKVEASAFRYHGFIATYFLTGIHHETLLLFTDLHPLATVADARDYIARLGQLDTRFTRVSEHLNRQRAEGIVEPRLTLQPALDDVRSLLSNSVETNPYYTAFRDKLNGVPGLSGSERDELLAEARSRVETSVVPGYEQLEQTLQSLLEVAPDAIGVGQYPRGGDYYAWALRHHTTTDLTAAEIHQLGLDELVRIHGEMRAIFDALGYPANESLRQSYARVASDGGIVAAAQSLATFEALIEFAEARLDQAFDIFPPADVLVRPDPYGGYYVGPSFDGTRPGVFYASTSHDQPWYPMPSVTFHESVPGHHLQISIAMHAVGPDFRKALRFTAYVEGWAFYAERLAWELGWYDGDPYGNLGRLQYEAVRAARLVLDTGIHYYGWSFDRAVRFSEDNVGASPGASQEAVRRYSVTPGQATAYMVGMLKILEARERARNMLVDKFDLKEFHRVVLTSGAVPLQLLDTIVDSYIAAKLAEGS